MNKALRIAYVILIIAIFALIIQTVLMMPFMVGDWVYIRDQYVQSLPWVFTIGLGFWWLIKYRGGGRSFIGDFFICGLIGVGFAGLSYFLYINGIWLDNYITGIQTIREFMFIVVLIWVIIGLVIGFSNRR